MLAIKRPWNFFSFWQNKWIALIKNKKPVPNYIFLFSFNGIHIISFTSSKLLDSHSHFLSHTNTNTSTRHKRRFVSSAHIPFIYTIIKTDYIGSVHFYWVSVRKKKGSQGVEEQRRFIFVILFCFCLFLFFILSSHCMMKMKRSV